jgi:hypothetical protein
LLTELPTKTVDNSVVCLFLPGLSEKGRAAQGLLPDSRLVSGAIIENPPRSGIPAKLTGFRLHLVGLRLAIPATFKSYFVLIVLCSFKATGARRKPTKAIRVLQTWQECLHSHPHNYFFDIFLPKRAIRATL